MTGYQHQGHQLLFAQGSCHVHTSQHDAFEPTQERSHHEDEPIPRRSGVKIMAELLSAMWRIYKLLVLVLGLDSPCILTALYTLELLMHDAFKCSRDIYTLYTLDTHLLTSQPFDVRDSRNMTLNRLHSFLHHRSQFFDVRNPRNINLHRLRLAC